MKTAVPLFLIALLILPMDAYPDQPWQRHTVDGVDHDAGTAGADGVRLGDLNRDGLPDVVTGWEEGGAIRVCFHPGFDKTKERWPAVTVGKVKSPEDAVFADLDSDGILDVVSATEGKSRSIYVHWAPGDIDRVADASAWATSVLPASENTQWWMFTLPLDVDRDGDTDLVAGSKNAGASVSWIENPGGERSRNLADWTIHKISAASWIMSLRLLEQDEERYLVYSDRKGDASGVYLAKLLPESPWFDVPALVGAAGEEVMFLDLARLNEDETMDIAVAIRPDKVRIFYQPEDILRPWSEFSDLDPLSPDNHGTAKAVRVGDMNGDEIPEFVITCENASGTKHGVFMSDVFSEFSAVSGPEGIKFDRIELLDLDDDGDLDILTCEEREGLGVCWFENPAK